MTVFGYTLQEFCFNLVAYYIIHLFSEIVLNHRMRSRWRFAVYLAFVVTTIFCASLIPKMTILNIIMLPVELMIFNLLLFRDSPLRSVFTAWLAVALMFLAEIVVVAMYYPPEVIAMELSTATMADQMTIFVTEIAVLALFYWLAALVMNRVKNRFKMREILMYMFLPISQLVLIVGWLRAIVAGGIQDQQRLVIVVTLVCLAADIGLFASMLRVSRQIELEAENRLLAAQISAQREHYEQLTTQYESIRRMRHDIAKHFDAMDALLAAGRVAEAGEYVEQLAGEYDRNPVERLPETNKGLDV